MLNTAYTLLDRQHIFILLLTFSPVFYLFHKNSLRPKSVLAGTKNSRSEGFLLVKHKHTNIPTMMEPFAPPAAWDLWILPIVRADPLPKGSGGGVVEGI